MNYDHNENFGLFKFSSGYGKFNLSSPKGYSLRIINAQTEHNTYLLINCTKLYQLVSTLCIDTNHSLKQFINIIVQDFGHVHLTSFSQ